MNIDWKNADYLNQVERFADILSKSKSTNIYFQGDKETCAILIMQADMWNLHPMFVAANSFPDSYGRVAQNGRLMKEIIEKSELVEKLTHEYKGNWDAVNHKFKMEHERAVPLWNPESEDGLALDITVKFKNGETYKETMYLSDVDYSFRSLNDSWASSPKKQLFNYTIRNIGHFALSNIVNYFDSSDAMKEQDANEKVKKSKPSNISQGNGTQQSEHITLTQLKVIAESILNMASSLSGQNKVEQEQSIADIESKTHEWVALYKQDESLLSDSEKVAAQDCYQKSYAKITEMKELLNTPNSKAA